MEKIARLFKSSGIMDKVWAINPWHLVWGAVVIAEMLTALISAIQSYIRWGYVPSEIIIIGAIDALFASLLIAPALIFLASKISKLQQAEMTLKQLNNDLETRVLERTQSLTASEEKYRQLIENSIEAIFVLSEGSIVYANTAMLSLLREREQPLVGTKFIDLVDISDRDRVSKSLRAAVMAQEVQRMMDFCMNIGYGQKRWVEMSTIAITWEGSPALLTFMTDITEQRNLRGQLLQAKKMEAIGTLAGGIAHDFNNILQAMSGYLSLFLIHAPAELNVSYVKKAELMIERAASLTRGLLAFSRKQQADMILLDLNALVGQFHALIARVIGEHITLHVRHAPGELNIVGNKALLEQVLMNMAINARDAMPHGGELRVEVEAIDLSEAAALVNGCDRPGSYALISITDTGAGISFEMTQKIFDPFFTTKEVGQGTGLGLAISFGTIRQHGGNITVDSEEGEGTTFRIYLPLSGNAPAFTQQEKLEDVLGGTETVLFVEDFGPARDTMRIVLEERGYRVIEAVDGKEALAVFRSSKNHIDIVVTDVVMPNMSGKDLADLIREEKPDTKFIFVSGYTPESVKEKWHKDIGVVMAKPFSPSLLARKIREVLDEFHG